MATLTWIDGIEHQIATTGIVASGVEELWTAVNNPSRVSIVAGRNSGSAIQFDSDGVTATNAAHLVTGTTSSVFSGYFKLTRVPTVTNSTIWGLTDGTTTMCRLAISSTGIVRAQSSGGTRTDGPNVNDGAWHRADVYLDSSGATWPVRWFIDGGTELTTATDVGHVSTPVVRIALGTLSNNNDLAVVWDDCIFSQTSGDFPLGAHAVYASVPDAEGTDHLGTTNVITFTGAATGWQSQNTWPPDGTKYVSYTSTATGDAASNYAETSFQDKNAQSGTIMAVYGNAAIWAAGSSADNGTTRIVDSANATLTDIFSGDQSQTTVRYTSALIAPPGAGWASGFNGVKARVGFSTDTNPQPRWSGLMLQYATSSSEDITIQSVVATATAAAIAPTIKITTAAVIATATAAAIAGSPLTGNPPVVVAGAVATAVAAALAHTAIAPVGRLGLASPNPSTLGNIVLGEPGGPAFVTATGIFTSATAAALVPTFTISVPAVVASAQAVAVFPPFVGGSANQTPPPATATASAPVPVISIRIAAPVATAFATAIAGTVDVNNVSAIIATATADAFVPTFRITVQAVVASATASAPAGSIPATPAAIEKRGRWNPFIDSDGMWDDTIDLQGRSGT